MVKIVTESTQCAKVLLRDRDSDMVTVLLKSKSINPKLEVLDIEANRLLLCIAFREGSPVDSTRISVTSGLRIKLKELMNDFKKLREVIVSEHKEETPSEEMIEKMISGGGQFEIAAVQTNYLDYFENLERQKAVKVTQRSLMELHQFFLDIAVFLVDSQVEKIHDIEQDMARAGYMMTSSVTHRLKAAKSTIKRDMGELITVLRKAEIINSILEAPDKCNEANRLLLCIAFKEGSSVDRTRISVTDCLRIKLKELMNDFKKLREVIVSEHKEGLKRRYFSTAGETPSEEMIEKVISGGGQLDIFAVQSDLDYHLKNLNAVKVTQRSSITVFRQFFSGYGSVFGGLTK